ncbi:hypothetical protein D3C83_328820 [compost metagenome]
MAGQKPAKTPGFIIGRVTRRKVDQPVAPRLFAASSSRGPMRISTTATAPTP